MDSFNSARLEIRVTNDFAFKRIFGQEDTKDILAAFLSDVLGYPVSSDIELENTEVSPEYLRDKASRLDITARIRGVEKINIEIQLVNEHNISKRTLYYWSKYYARDLGEGQNYRELVKTVSIILIDYEVFKGDAKNYHNVFCALEKTRHEPFFDDFEIHVIELPKFLKLEKTNLAGLDGWMLFLERAGDEKTMAQVMEKKPIIRRAMNVAQMMERNKQERWLYEMREKGLKDIRSIEEHAREEGREEGERLKAFETARNLLARNIPVNVIAESTGLSEADVMGLKN